MHNIRAIREEADAFDAALARRGLAPAASEILSLDDARRAAILAAETLRAEQKATAKAVGAAKAQGNDTEFERLRAQVAEKKAQESALNEEARAKDAQLTKILMGIENVLDPSVPDGNDEADNLLLETWGTPRHFAFEPKQHFEIPGATSGLDFATAAKLSGSRFVVLRGAMARLHRALAQFMIDLHVDEHGLIETATPVLVREEAMYGTGQLPKFADGSYQTSNGWWLISTSEITLTNSVADEILDLDNLPMRLTAHTQCFRSEAGSAGKDTTGMLRQHQFEKVEMVTICHPDQSAAEHERMMRCARTVLERLALPYRVMLLCAGDTGFSATKTFDLEVWLPGQNSYREISSISNCRDFQARRMNARYRPEGGKPDFVHTLNGSGLAVGRCLIAVLENYQNADGSITIPELLRPYLGGKTAITAEGVVE